MRFVMATGIYGQHYAFLPHYFQNRDVDALVDVFVHDLEQGIQGTAVRAHFLKCAADEPGLTPDVEKVHRAVAQASLRTGAPIMAHTHPATHTGLAQMGIFAEEGVDPSKVLLAHTGDTDDLDHIEQLLATGATLGHGPLRARQRLPAGRAAQRDDRGALRTRPRGPARAGPGRCATIDWFPAELRPVLAPDWHFSLIFERIMPAARRRRGGRGRPRGDGRRERAPLAGRLMPERLRATN